MQIIVLAADQIDKMTSSLDVQVLNYRWVFAFEIQSNRNSRDLNLGAHSSPKKSSCVMARHPSYGM